MSPPAPSPQQGTGPPTPSTSNCWRTAVRVPGRGPSRSAQSSGSAWQKLCRLWEVTLPKNESAAPAECLASTGMGLVFHPRSEKILILAKMRRPFLRDEGQHFWKWPLSATTQQTSRPWKKSARGSARRKEEGTNVTRFHGSRCPCRGHQSPPGAQWGRGGSRQPPAAPASFHAGPPSS